MLSKCIKTPLYINKFFLYYFCKKVLTNLTRYGIVSITSQGVFFLCAKMRRAREGGKTNWEVPINASQNYSRLHGVQATQLQHDEEQEERSGQT